MNHPFPKCGSGRFVGHCWRVTQEVGEKDKEVCDIG